MKYSVLCIGLLLMVACDDDSPSEPALDATVPCTQLFGQPTASTGLSAEQCGASCACGTTPFTPPSYTEAQVEDLRRFTLMDGPAELETDPYESTLPAAPALGTVCGALFDEADADAYRLIAYDSAEAANAAGARVTHAGPCGLCSSLQNLTVYMGNPDLTDPVRQCGIEGIAGGMEQNVACLQAIGFDLPCAQIWYYNTNHTRAQCFDLCIAHLNSPHHTEDGSLNPCIQCDEDRSGPIFKAISGRTRRNSGLPSALCRPCDTVYPLEHQYP